MKHCNEIFSSYIERNKDKFEKAEHGAIITPDGDKEAFSAWCSDFDNSSSNLYDAFTGITKKEICAYAETVIKGLANDASDDHIEILMKAVDAFADWEKEWTQEPEVVLSYCKALEHLLIDRWRDKSHTMWPSIALHLLFCELGIRAFHRLGAGEAETRLHGLLLNSAIYFSINEPLEPSVSTTSYDN